MQPYNGLLLVNKPEGLSSFRIVSRVRGILRTASGQKNIKVGHSGTLDPAATGLLILAIGKYTKKMPELIKHNKTYLVEMTLGKVSTTGDKEGDISTVSSNKPSEDEINNSLEHFTGNQMQTPPAFSAIKVNGQRSYDLARKGQKTELKPRPVTIYENKLLSYNYPIANFVSTVSSGTYIRSLVEDIGKELAVGAYMSNLKRTVVGDYNLDDAIPFDELSFEAISKRLITIE